MHIQTCMKGKRNTTESNSEETEITRCEQTHIHISQSSVNVCTYAVIAHSSYNRFLKTPKQHFTKTKPAGTALVPTDSSTFTKHQLALPAESQKTTPQYNHAHYFCCFVLPVLAWTQLSNKNSPTQFCSPVNWPTLFWNNTSRNSLIQNQTEGSV